MSRLRQRRLQQLRQTVQEKVELLCRQREELMTVLDEYLQEARSAAEKLLSSQDTDVCDNLYLDVIRQLDRRSQVCIQLTSKTYEIIDADADEVNDQVQAAVNSPVADQSQNLSQVTAVVKEAPADNHHPLPANSSLADASLKTPYHHCSPSSASSSGLYTSVKGQSDHSHPPVPATSSVLHTSVNGQSDHFHPPVPPTSPVLHTSAKGQSDHCHPPFPFTLSMSEEFMPSPGHWQLPVSNASSNVGPLAEAPGVPKETAAGRSSGSDIVPCKLPEGTPVRVVVSSVENPWSFYVLTSVQEVFELSSKIRKSKQQQSKSLESIRKGTACLAKFTDGVYYRACVQYVQNDCVEVFFTDFGNTHSCKKTSLLPLPAELQTLPALAIHCCLAGVRPKSRSGLWPDEAISLFSQSLDQEVVCDVLWQAPPRSSIPTIVNLTWPAPASSQTAVGSEVTSNNMSAYLINHNVAQAIDLATLRSCLLDAKRAGAGEQFGVDPDMNKVSGKTTACCDTSPATEENAGLCSTARVHCSGKAELRASESKINGKREPCQNSVPGLSKSLGVQNVTNNGVKQKLRASETLGAAGLIKHDRTKWSGDGDTDISKMPRRMNISDVSLSPQKTVHSSLSSEVHQTRKAVPSVTEVRNDRGLPSQQLPVFSERPEVQNIRDVGIQKVATSETPWKPLKHGAAVTQAERNVARMVNIQLEKTLHRKDGEICRTGSESDSDDKQSISSKSDSVYDEMDICDKMPRFKALVSTVVSPSDFYLHKICRETGQVLLSMMEELNKEFEGMPENILQDYSKQLVVKPGVLCCARFTYDGSYYRAIILQTRTDPTSKSFISCELEVQVLYVDYGDTEWLAVSRVYPLSKDYCMVPPQALWCSLACVQPADVGQKGQWLPKAVSAFKQLVEQDKVLTVFVLSGDIFGRAPRGCAVQTSPLQVLLVDEEDDNLCINHELFLCGCAAIKPLPSTDGMRQERSTVNAEDGGDEDRWVGMKEDANSLRNTYNVDIADVGVATTGIKESGRNRAVCKYFNRSSQCWKGKNCRFLHMKPGMHTSMSGNLKQVLVYDEDQSDILPKAGTSVIAEVTAGQNPSFFYVVLPWGPYGVQQVTDSVQEVLDYVKEETLHSLNTAMQSFYKNKRLDTDYLVYGKGEAVAARCRRTGVWLRAKVIDTDPDKEEVQVLYVDFGNMEWVSEHSIRQLELQFIHLPPQAIECSLNGVVPKWPQEFWAEKASAIFLNLVKGKALVAHVITSTCSTRLVMDLWDTTGSEDINIADILIQEGLASHATADDNDRPRQTPGGVDFVPGRGRRASSNALTVCYAPG